MLKGTEAGSFISGFRVRNGENSLLVSHVLIADDTILFCDATLCSTDTDMTRKYGNF